LRRELEVRALPDRLPDKIEVDVSLLQIGDSVHVTELNLPEGVEAIDVHENFTLVTVVPPTVEEVAAPVEGAAAAEGAVAGAPGTEGAPAGGAAKDAKEGKEGKDGKESKGKDAKESKGKE
jgi:large subunit ribosomal protein L25